MNLNKAKRLSIYNNVDNVTITYNANNELKVKENGIDTIHIKNNAVTTEKLSDGAVTNTKISGRLSLDKMPDGTNGYVLTAKGINANPVFEPISAIYSLNDLNDVTINNASNRQIIVYNNTEWINEDMITFPILNSTDPDPPIIEGRLFVKRSDDNNTHLYAYLKIGGSIQKVQIA